METGTRAGVDVVVIADDGWGEDREEKTLENVKDLFGLNFSEMPQPPDFGVLIGWGWARVTRFTPRPGLFPRRRQSWLCH